MFRISPYRVTPIQGSVPSTGTGGIAIRFLSDLFSRQMSGEQVQGLLMEENRLLVELQKRYREPLMKRLSARFSSLVTASDPKHRKFQAEMRAGIAINTVLPYVAAYVTIRKSNPDLEIKDKERILGKMHDEMTAGLIPQVVPDLVEAFGVLIHSFQNPESASFEN